MISVSGRVIFLSLNTYLWTLLYKIYDYLNFVSQHSKLVFRNKITILIKVLSCNDIDMNYFKSYFLTLLIVSLTGYIDG